MKELRERVGSRLLASLSVSMFAGLVLGSGATVFAQDNARKGKASGQQLLDPFSLETVFSGDNAIAASESERQGNQGNGKGQGPPVDVPRRRRPRSPYVPPGPPDGPPPGPPPWVL
jgi:hypothetical protein